MTHQTLVMGVTPDTSPAQSSRLLVPASSVFSVTDPICGESAPVTNAAPM